MPNHRWQLAAMTLPLVLACHRGMRYANEDPVEPDEGEFPQGVFYYQATAMNQRLAGRLIIVDTMVIVEPIGDTCFTEHVAPPRSRVLEEVRFECHGAPTPSGLTTAGTSTRIVVNLRRPKRDSRWGRLTILDTAGTNASRARACEENPITRGDVCRHYSYLPGRPGGWQWGRLHVRRAPFPADTTGSLRPRPQVWTRAGGDAVNATEW